MNIYDNINDEPFDEYDNEYDIHDVDDIDLTLFNKLIHFKDIDNNLFFIGYNGFDYIITETKDEKYPYVVHTNFENIKLSEQSFTTFVDAYIGVLNYCMTSISKSSEANCDSVKFFNKIYNITSSLYPNVKLIKDKIIIPFLFPDNKFVLNEKSLTHIIIYKLPTTVKVSIGTYNKYIEKYSVKQTTFIGVIKDIYDLFISKIAILSNNDIDNLNKNNNYDDSE